MVENRKHGTGRSLVVAVLDAGSAGTREYRGWLTTSPDSFWWIHHENHPDVVIARFHPARLVVLEYVIDGLD